jgi:hypothetical protein
VNVDRIIRRLDALERTSTPPSSIDEEQMDRVGVAVRAAADQHPAVAEAVAAFIASDGSRPAEFNTAFHQLGETMDATVGPGWAQ